LIFEKQEQLSWLCRWNWNRWHLSLTKSPTMGRQL